jgi:hypothetical protein
MSLISTSRTTHRRDSRSRKPDEHAAGPHSVGLRLRVAAHRDRLNRDLAHGVNPASSAEHALRAAQLTSDRRCKELVRTWRDIVAEAHRPRLRISQVVVIHRPAVLDAEDAIHAMIERLSYAQPVSAEGMAIAERIITNADNSPLYNSAEPGTLRRMVHVATEALDPAPRGEHELAAA